MVEVDRFRKLLIYLRNSTASVEPWNSLGKSLQSSLPIDLPFPFSRSNPLLSSPSSHLVAISSYGILFFNLHACIHARSSTNFRPFDASKEYQPSHFNKSKLCPSYPVSFDFPVPYDLPFKNSQKSQFGENRPRVPSISF